MKQCPFHCKFERNYYFFWCNEKTQYRVDNMEEKQIKGNFNTIPYQNPNQAMVYGFISWVRGFESWPGYFTYINTV